MTNEATSPETGRTKTDWEAIERDYRAGQLSLREIGKLHGVSDTAIRKRAAKACWERDLSQRVDTKVRTDLVRNLVRTANPQTEDEIVNEAAALRVEVVRGHHRHIGRQIELVEILTEQLVSASGKREDIEGVIAEETAEDQNGKRRAAMMRAVSLPTHTSAVVNLTNALKTLIGLERQAFSIRDESEAPTSASPLASLLEQIQGTPLRPRSND